MSVDATPKLGLPYLAAAQAQKHVTVNEALVILDLAVQSVVDSRTQAIPDAAGRAEGAALIVPAGGAGAACPQAQPGDILSLDAGAWRRTVPGEGWLTYVRDESAVLVRTSAGWIPLGGNRGAQRVDRLGVGTDPDATNPLAVKAGSALLSAQAVAEGGSGDFRLVVSKSSAAATASVVLQTNYSGRAELGLSGDDDLHIKVSADGQTWSEAMRVNAAAGVRLGLPLTTSGVGGLVCRSGSDAFPVALVVQGSTHATSRRAAIQLGVWVLGQDAFGSGQSDLFAYNPGLGVAQLRLPPEGGLEVEGRRVVAAGGDLAPRASTFSAIGPAAPPGRMRLVTDRSWRPAFSDGSQWRWADGSPIS